MKFKTMTSILAAAGMLMTFISLPAGAAEPFAAEDNGDGTVSIRCTDPSIIHAEIPETLDGKPVTALSNNCFDGCSELETVTLPEGLTRIGDFSFQGCAMLETIEIPASVTEIQDFCFEGCLSLTAIYVAEGNEAYTSLDGVLYTHNATQLVRYPAAKEGSVYTVEAQCGTISPWGFTDCQNLEAVTLEQVNAMGADCFMGCKKLRKVKLSDGLTELIGAAFAQCSSLKTINIPDSVKSIGDRCFFGCTSLTEMKLPEGLTSIGEGAFFGCKSIQAMDIPGSVQTIGKEGVGFTVDSEGRSIVIPEFRIFAPVGSQAIRYAKENGIDCQGTLTPNQLLFGVIGCVLVILLIVGAVVSVKRSKAQKLAEAERIAAEEKEKKLAERRAARKKQKEQKE